MGAFKPSNLDLCLRSRPRSHFHRAWESQTRDADTGELCHTHAKANTHLVAVVHGSNAGGESRPLSLPCRLAAPPGVRTACTAAHDVAQRVTRGMAKTLPLYPSKPRARVQEAAPPPPGSNSNKQRDGAKTDQHRHLRAQVRHRDARQHVAMLLLLLCV